ncbi:hypothetical protein BU17DRAFT_65753 [Hysterangium stoloniferum]|nr:hypothetical protein BU17DRAFT_65753 [Hysterangium stoloniferum]
MSSGNEDRDVDPELTRPVTSNNTSVSRREYYPLNHHQREFDELERFNDGGQSRLNEQYSLGRLVDRGALPPPHTVSVIIKCAILGSPKQKLTLKEIRIAMIQRFIYFEESQNDGWCNTVRHILSIESDFMSVNRLKTNEDAGSWWMLSSTAELPDMRPGARASSRSTSQHIPRGESSGARPLKPKKGKEEPIWAEMTSSFSSSLSLRNSSPRSPASASHQIIPVYVVQKSEDGFRASSWPGPAAAP